MSVVLLQDDKDNLHFYVSAAQRALLNTDTPADKFALQADAAASSARGPAERLSVASSPGVGSGDSPAKEETDALRFTRNVIVLEITGADVDLALIDLPGIIQAEPEDGEKFNISLLKELTGSEEIVARGLYQESVSFVMEAKLFLACNELPAIKAEDTALWRRIRVVDFPSRFVDDPKEPEEYKIDRTLPSRMREELSWKQTFIIYF